LVAAVEGQAREAPPLRHDHSSPTSLLHRDNIVAPALQRADRAVEEPRRDFVSLERLEPACTSRPHACKSQDHTRASNLAARPPGAAAEIGEFKLQVRQKLIVGWQPVIPQNRWTRACCGGIVITLC